MQICRTNVLSNKINSMNHANMSKLHEYYNNFDGKLLIQIFYVLKYTTLSTAVKYENFPLSTEAYHL